MINRMLKIFKGNQDYFNFCIPLNIVGEKKQVKCSKFNFIEINRQMAEHLQGKGIVGIIPIVDKIYSWYGVIDIDEYKGVDVLDLYNLVQKYGGFIFKSKSGGIHIYFFSKYKIEAFVMREFLEKVSKEINYKHEIFPKQDFIDNNFGSTINLPFFNKADSCFDGKDWIGFAGFENNYKTIDINKLLEIQEESSSNKNDLPGCLKYLLENLHEGIKHNTLYNLCVYLRIKYGTDAKEQFDIFFNKYFSDTSYDKAIKILTSVKESKAFYQCNGFLKEYCIGKPKCRTSTKYGISNGEEVDFDVEKLIQYKLSSEESSYKLIVSGNEINFEDMVTFWSFKKFRLKAIEQVIGFHPPKVSQELWEETLKPILDNREVKDLEESDDYGEFKQAFMDWINVNCLSEDYTDYNLSGVFYSSAKKKIYFNLIKFKQHIKKKKILKDKQIPKFKDDLFDDLSIKNTTYDIYEKKLNVKIIDFESIGFTVTKEEF